MELPGGARGLLPPPRYTTVPDLRKGNASRCNIKRASPMDGPPQPLRGGTRRGGRGGAAPPSYAPEWLWSPLRPHCTLKSTLNTIGWDYMSTHIYLTIKIQDFKPYPSCIRTLEGKTSSIYIHRIRQEFFNLTYLDIDRHIITSSRRGGIFNLQLISPIIMFTITNIFNVWRWNVICAHPYNPITETLVVF